MRKALLVAIITVSFSAQAQPVYVDRIGFKLESIEDIDIGWMKMYKATTAAKGRQLGNRIYSASQIGYTQEFITWMQQSYLPRGCLGDAGYYLNAIPKFSGTNSQLGNEINTHRNALPHLYGAFSKMYMFLKKDAQGKFVPQNTFAEFWNIEANQLENISMPVSFISSADEYYFVLPDFNSNTKGYDAVDKAASNFKDFNIHNNMRAYQHFYIPPKTMDDFPHYVVILTKNNKELPFEKITIGEFFTLAEKQLPVWQKVTDVSAENLAKAQKNLARLKEKYKSKWNDIAELELSTQIDIWSFINATEGYNDFFDNKDIYGKGIHTTFPILKVSKAAKELCKTDQPQWLIVRWTMGMPTKAFNIHLHASILNHSNFEYLHHFFYDPEKIKNQPYKSLLSPLYKEAVVITDASKTSKKNTTDKNIYFFEDFSSTGLNTKPIGWQTKLAPDGNTSVVKKVDGLDGNWAVMRNSYFLSPSQLKNPLPQNFTMSYDLVATQNFTWGSNGLTFQLSKETSPGNAESYIKLKIRPGFEGKDGEAAFETKFTSPPGYLTGSKWFDAKGFSNNKNNNRITVIIKKKEESLSLFIDSNKIVEYEKAVPAALLFNTFTFSNGSLGANDSYYIGNIKIIKD
jgi:hypothetical protein